MSNEDEKRALARYPVHLGLGGTAVPQPEFNGVQWYAGYGERHDGDGVDGRLLSMHTFSEPWAMWEMHPVGAEVVIVTAGEMTLIQGRDGEGEQTRVRLGVGEYAVNPPGVWHTADVESSATAVFITAGEGTLNEPR